MTVLVRLGLAVLILDTLVVGAWNQFFPQGFYDHFPTANSAPPFSEHFARDFGGALLGIAAVLIVAFVRPNPAFVGMGALAFTAFSVPHFVFHSLHLDHLSTGDVVFLELSNAAVALVGILLGLWSLVRLRRAARTP